MIGKWSDLDHDLIVAHFQRSCGKKDSDRIWLIIVTKDRDRIWLLKKRIVQCSDSIIEGCKEKCTYVYIMQWILNSKYLVRGSLNYLTEKNLHQFSLIQKHTYCFFYYYLILLIALFINFDIASTGEVIDLSHT